MQCAMVFHGWLRFNQPRDVDTLGGSFAKI